MSQHDDPDDIFQMGGRLAPLYRGLDLKNGLWIGIMTGLSPVGRMVIHEDKLLRTMRDVERLAEDALQEWKNYDTSTKPQDPDREFHGETKMYSLLREFFSKRLLGHNRPENQQQELRNKYVRAQQDVETVREQLQSVQRWLDLLVAQSASYAEIRESRRTYPRATPPPSNVTVFATIQDFIETDERRKLDRGQKRLEPSWALDAGGADYGSGWTWIDPDRPWIHTYWRLSYLDELGELYARRLDNPKDVTDPGERQTRQGPSVWLVHGDWRTPVREHDGNVDSAHTNAPAVANHVDSFDNRLKHLQGKYMKTPNSLLLLCGALAELGSTASSD